MNNTEIELPGLDGANPLAFLAALGMLRTLTRARPENSPKLKWQPRGFWQAVLCIQGKLTRSELVQTLYRQLSQADERPAFTLTSSARAKAVKAPASLKKMPPERYRSFLKAVLDLKQPDETTDFAAAWGSELPQPGKEEAITATSFDFTAGQQELLRMVRETIQQTTEEQLAKALFGPWDYGDTNLSLRWNLLDETRRYAYQAIDPTNTRANPIRTMRGADRLAIEALPFFPVIPTATGPQTVSHSRSKEKAFWSWPIWSIPLGADTVRSLLACDYTAEPDRARLRAQGIEVIYRSRVVMPSGYYRCFGPPQPV